MFWRYRFDEFCGVLVLISVFISASNLAVGQDLQLKVVDTYATGTFGKSAAEIPAYCHKSQQLFVVNAESGSVNVLRILASGELEPVTVIDAAADVGGKLGAVNSVSIHNGKLAVAVEGNPATETGVIAIYNTATLKLFGSVPVGALPDMVAFSPDGRWVVVANEGEPNDDYTIDPEGTVSIIDFRKGWNEKTVRHVNFRDWNVGGERESELPKLKADGLRFAGRVTLAIDPYQSRPATFAEDMEPEWVEISEDSTTAYVCLQENNTIAEIDLATAKVKRLMPLGYKDHGVVGNELDASDRDGGIQIRQWPGLMGVYQPDTIRLYESDGNRFLLTANEGDSRVRPYADGIVDGIDEGGLYSDEAVIGDWPLQGTPWETLVGPEALGRLLLVRNLVDANLDSEGRPTKLFSFGGRSFSIFDARSGEQIFDSGSDFERITAERYPKHFNASNDSTTFDKRSRSKGPEPEGMALGKIDGRDYAFIGLERIGGIMIYEITDPRKPVFVSYNNNRNFDVSPVLDDGSSNPEAGDTGIEGLIFIAADQSPTKTPLIVAGNETSGTTTVWSIVPLSDSK
jgi:DNA-binding beta-propeller fold protein YncE